VYIAKNILTFINKLGRWEVTKYVIFI